MFNKLVLLVCCLQALHLPSSGTNKKPADSYFKIPLFFVLSGKSISWMAYQCQHMHQVTSQRRTKPILPFLTSKGSPIQYPPPDLSQVNFICMCDTSSHLSSSKGFHPALPFLLLGLLLILFPQPNISSSLHTTLLKCHLFYEDTL